MHFENLTKKVRYRLAKMKFLSKYLDQTSMKRVITSYYFSIIYYGSPVWLAETTSSKHWHLLNILRYKGIRTVCRDFRKRRTKSELDNILSKAKPKQCMKFSCCKLTIKLLQLGPNNPPLSGALQQNLYLNDRTGKSSIMDTSRQKIGKSSFRNRLPCFKDINFNWKDGNSDDALKRTFF